MGDLVVQDVPRQDVITRVTKAEQDRAQEYGVPCICSCKCRVRHRFGEVCALCRNEDHWDVIVAYLDRVTGARRN